MRKTASFACLHFSVAFTLGWVMTGSWRVGGALAIIEPLCNTVVFHFHEKFWQARQGHRAAATIPATQQASPLPSRCRSWRHC